MVRKDGKRGGQRRDVVEVAGARRGAGGGRMAPLEANAADLDVDGDAMGEEFHMDEQHDQLQDLPEMGMGGDIEMER